MNRPLSALLLLTIILSACTGASANTTLEPVQTDIPALPPDTASAPTETPFPLIPSDTARVPTEAAANPKLPAAPFEAKTYVNEEVGFALDYPVGWTVMEVEVGPRGKQVHFLSSPELLDVVSVPEGETRLSAVIYQWDPKNDLDAFIANQKTAWEASGFTILQEQGLVLELGLPAYEFNVQTPNSTVIFLITAIGEQYLSLSGEGNLSTVNAIVQRVRPISP